MIIIKGIAASPGISIGKAYVLEDEEIVVTRVDIPHDRLRAEVQRFARERVQLERFTAWQLEEWSAAAPEPSAEAEHLLDCVRELPEPLRQLVALKYQEERSGDEIAAHLNRSAVWVRVSLFRVRQLLRDCVGRKAAPAGTETSPA